jgi:two-component system, sensor histidine kinase RegB
MPDRTPTAAADFATRSLRLETLVRLRWLAIAGQAVAVLFVRNGLGFPLPIVECVALIAISALLNIVLRFRFSASRRFGTWPAFSLLAYDALQLAGLLYLTGGLENPFALLLLVPVIVSATALRSRPTTLLCLLVVGLASGLAIFHRPLPWYPSETLLLPLVYVAGAWVALVLACIFIGVYTYRVAKEARRLAAALNATELVLAREQHLSALDGLAAAAAHELGAKELERELPPDSDLIDDIALLKSQSQRCRDILAKLTSLSGQPDQLLARLPLSHLLEEVVEPYRVFGIDIVVAPPQGAGPQPVGQRNPAIVYGLANLVENAVDFAQSRVDIGREWTESEVAVTIADDGPGFASDIIDRIGEPYVTSRGQTANDDDDAGGLGLGFFIAKTLLERTGARLHFANRTAPATGAVVRVVWPRAVMDAEVKQEQARDPEAAMAVTTWREPAKSL